MYIYIYYIIGPCTHNSLDACKDKTIGETEATMHGPVYSEK